MEPSNYQNIPDKPRYLNFPSLEAGIVIDGKQVLNRWSSTLTKVKLSDLRVYTY